MSSAAARLVPVDASMRLPEVLLANGEITIGRSRQSDLCLDDSSVSRQHARIRFLDGGYTLEDVGSSHGTVVNGQPVVVHRLAANDVIEVGIYKLRFVDPQSVAEPDAAPAQTQADHLRLLLNVTQVISSSLATDEVLKHVIDGVIQVTRAQRGFLMMVNPEGEMEFRVARNFDRTELTRTGLAASASVPARVRETQKAVVLSNTMEIGDASKSIMALGLRSVMCVPLKIQDRLIGLIYVDSQQQAKGFTGADLELFESLASQAALAIEKSRMYEELQRYSTSLEDQVRTRTAELVQAERMAAVGRLAAGIAHEINSPLGVISSNVEMLQHLVAALPGKQPDNEILEGISATFGTANARLRRIVKAFQALTGLDEAELKPVDINSLIEEVLVLLEMEIAKRIRVAKNFGDLKRVVCSPGRTAQAFMNVLLNAVQSIDGEGGIHIQTEQKQGRVRVTIRDSGRGMTPEQIATAFDAGFQKRDGRVAASLGLMITAQIIRERRGEIKIESTPGAGTTVIVTIPNSIEKN